MKDGVKISGEFSTKVTRINGTVEHHKFPNTVTSDGKTSMAGMLASGATSANEFNWIGIGTGSDSPAITDTDLVNQVYSRVSGLSSANGSQAIFSGTHTATGTVAITEYGVFNENTNGSMLARASGGTITLGSRDKLETTYRINIA